MLAKTTNQRSQCFKTKQCRFWLENRCTRGDQCTYAHTDLELRPTPNLKKTKMCARWRQNACILSSAACDYAHGAEDLRQDYCNHHNDKTQISTISTVTPPPPPPPQFSPLKESSEIDYDAAEDDTTNCPTKFLHKSSTSSTLVGGSQSPIDSLCSSRRQDSADFLSGTRGLVMIPAPDHSAVACTLSMSELSQGLCSAIYTE